MALASTGIAHASWVYYDVGVGNSALNAIRQNRAVGQYFGTTAGFMNLPNTPQGAINSGLWSTLGPGIANNTTGSQHVGRNSPNGTYWPNNIPSSVVLLTATGFPGLVACEATGIGTNLQCGYVAYYNPGITIHGGTWSNNTGPFVDYTPPGFWGSNCSDTDSNGMIVGAITQVPYGAAHAVVWLGSPTNFVDLNGPLMQRSSATTVDGSEQAGWFIPTGSTETQAVKWNGTAASSVVLHPGWAVRSNVNDNHSGFQVGYVGLDGGNDHAAIWSGTQVSCVDLHDLTLPPTYVRSEAKGIWKDPTSGITTVVGNAQIGSETHAVIWREVPDQLIQFGLILQDTTAVFAAPRTTTFVVKQGLTVIGTGYATNLGTNGIFTIPLPASFTGPAEVTLDGTSFLKKKVTVNLTGASQIYGIVTMKNGDADLSGEVDAVDIDLVISEFGSNLVDPADVDVSGEVDSVDIDIVIANFGNMDD